MIFLTRLDETPFVVNSDLIQRIDITPDTVLVLVNGERILVRETPTEVVSRVIAFRRSLLAASSPPIAGETAPGPGGPVLV